MFIWKQKGKKKKKRNKEKKERKQQENKRDKSSWFYTPGQNASSAPHASLSRHFTHVHNLGQTIKSRYTTPKAPEIQLQQWTSHADGTDENDDTEMNPSGYREKHNPANAEPGSWMTLRIRRFIVNNHKS